MSTIVYGKDRNKKYELGQKINSGGEGTVYSIVGHSNLVAKIYKPDRLSNVPLIKATEDKILAMLNMNFDPRIDGKLIVAWPTDTLYDSSGSFLGYVMPKIENMKSLIWAMRPSDRASLWPKGYRWSYSIAIAYNLSLVIEKLHSSGIIVGDMNTNNILISPSGNVTLIDAGSFNITTRDGKLCKCIVGFPEVLPPELQGKDLTKPNNQFSDKTDCFALAIHIFTLLNNNCHPFGCLNYNTEHASSSSPRIMDNIVKGFCPYVNGKEENTVEDSLGMGVFSNDINALFKRAFYYNATSAVKQSTIANRPTAKEWREALAGFLKAGFITCIKEPSHEYSTHYTGGCPWCAIENKKNGGNGTGIGTGTSTGTGTGTNAGSSPRSIKHLTIPIIYCDRDGNKLRSSNIDVEYGKTGYAYAIDIPGYRLVGDNSRREVSVDQNGRASQNDIRFTYEKDIEKKKKKHGFLRFLCVASILYCLIMYGMISSSINNSEYEKALEYMGMFPFYSELFPGDYSRVNSEVTRIENQRRDQRLKNSIKLPFGVKPSMTRSEAHNSMKTAGFSHNFTSDDGTYFYYSTKISGWYKTDFSTLYKGKDYMYIQLFFTRESVGNQITLSTVYNKIRASLIESYGQPSEKNSYGENWKSGDERYQVFISQDSDVVVSYYYYYSTN